MEKQVKLKTGKSLSKLLENIVNESLKTGLANNAAEEKKKQQMLGEEDDAGLFGDKGSADDKPAESKTGKDEKDKLKKGEITSKDIVDKLNTIRGGKSFKEEAIAKQLDQYVESLSKPEKVALMAFLKGLSQIVTGEIAAEKAIDPSSNPADVSMEKSEAGEKKKASVKPNVIKAPKIEKKPEKSAEDTSGPVPIKPKSK